MLDDIKKDIDKLCDNTIKTKEAFDNLSECSRILSESMHSQLGNSCVETVTYALAKIMVDKGLCTKEELMNAISDTSNYVAVGLEMKSPKIILKNILR